MEAWLWLSVLAGCSDWGLAPAVISVAATSRSRDSQGARGEAMNASSLGAATPTRDGPTAGA